MWYQPILDRDLVPDVTTAEPYDWDEAFVSKLVKNRISEFCDNGIRRVRDLRPRPESLNDTVRVKEGGQDKDFERAQLVSEAETERLTHRRRSSRRRQFEMEQDVRGLVAKHEDLSRALADEEKTWIFYTNLRRRLSAARTPFFRPIFIHSPFDFKGVDFFKRDAHGIAHLAHNQIFGYDGAGCAAQVERGDYFGRGHSVSGPVALEILQGGNLGAQFLLASQNLGTLISAHN